MNRFIPFQLLAVTALFLNINLLAQDSLPPFQVNRLYDFKQPATLGLPFAEGIETNTIFAPKTEEKQYNHGVVLCPFGGFLFAQWQSSAQDEDSEDTQVFISRSLDGTIWTDPFPLTEKWADGIKTSGGWWSNGDTLVAYICVWPKAENGIKQGYTEYTSTLTGMHWAAPQPLLGIDGEPVQGIIEQDVHQLPSGRLLTAFHLQPGLIATPFYTDDPLGIRGWTAGRMDGMPIEKNRSRGIEPSFFTSAMAAS